MTTSQSQEIRCAQNGPIAELTLNRPQRRNAMSPTLVEQLLAALDVLEFSPDILAILLKGEGDGFCAGSDLSCLAQMTRQERARFETASRAVARRIGQMAKPVVAAVTGFAIGGGLTLAAACDIVITDPASRWSLPEVPIGLFPAWGLSAVAMRIGVPAARRLCWGIDTLNGEQAEAIGLADNLAQDPVGEAMALCQRLVALPPKQAQTVKHFFASHAADEASDLAANRLFMEATGSVVARASFKRYGVSH